MVDSITFSDRNQIDCW